MQDSKFSPLAKPPQSAQRDSADHFAMEERIYFAALALQNVQELNARADSKAYLVMTANGFLITFLGWMAGPVKNVWSQGLSLGLLAHAAATLALIATVAISLLHAFHIMLPRLGQARQPGGEPLTRVHASDLLFFQDIIQHHATDREYTQALLAATPDELLKNLASSIYGSSISAAEKYQEAQVSIRALVPVLISWVAFVGLTFALN